MKEGKEAVLLEKAKVEEKGYNWIEAAKLYEQAAKFYLDNKMVKIAADTYKKLGYAYSRATWTAEEAEEYVERNKLTANAYKNAANLYKKTKNRAEELECLAEASIASGNIADSVTEAKESFDKSLKIFIESSEFYSNKDDQESVARTLSRASIASWFLVSFCSERLEIDQVLQKAREISEKAWKISKEVGNIQSLAESLLTVGAIGFIDSFIVPFRWSEGWKEYFRKSLLMCDESLMLADGYNDSRVLGAIYATAGRCYGFFGVQFIEDERKQREIIDKGIAFCEKGLIYAKDAKDKQLILWSLFWLDWWALIGGRFEYLLKRIFDDLHKIAELGKIYVGLYSLWRFYTNFLPTICYANFAQKSFFTPVQRKSYAEKGIIYAKESLKVSSYSPFFAWPYQMLTWSYSQLISRATTKNERDEHAQNMLECAKQAAKISENFEGGLSRAAGYSSLYRSYKTLADITDNKEEKIKMLMATIDAQKKYIRHAMEGRTGLLAAQIRLGFLYEELGIITGEINPLMQAKEAFISVVKESLEKGYYSYAAATHEYIAHIEDRMGNYTTSAQHYENAQESHTESLKIIKYKPLKDRVKEKIDYTCAWKLIELAKDYHKKEDHLKAKENYEKACEILKELPNYNYEAPYYFAWVSQEVGERLSKQEKHEEAIKSYEKTKKSFENAIVMLEKVFKQSKDKIGRSRIEKLKKVAMIRINYCSARINIEEARILEKQGNHQSSATKFASAASQFREVCSYFKIEREREELEAVYYLCRAWESMELAENYEDPNKFTEASELFTKASNLFFSNKMKSLASGNSTFCKALEYGCKFDESPESKVKAELYPKIKVMLRKATSSYRKGGFENGADWALATSTYFDAAWHLIRADEEMRLDEKKKLLEVGSGFLKSASELFNKAGYEHKEKEILELIDMIEKEEKILVSALNTIKEPSISRSTVGFGAPACPVETSLSPRISEAKQLTEESSRVIEERAAKKKYKLIYRDLFKVYPRIQRRECRVAIAQIGLSNTGDILSEFYEEKATGLLNLREDKVKIIRSNVKSMIKIANTKGINILLFPEMTIDLNYGQLLEDISNLAKIYGMYIIPGSYHDQETKRNLSVVIGPDGILWEQEKHIPAIIHLEGKKFKERIDVGTLPRKTIICNTEFGRIAIIICRDFLDMDLRVELKNFEPPVDIILNPAFTPVTADFKAAHFDARRSIYAYCFFANVAEFGNSLIYTPEKERIERRILPKEEDLIYKDIDLFKLRSERKKWEKEQNKERKFIQSTR